MIIDQFLSFVTVNGVNCGTDNVDCDLIAKDQFDLTFKQ